MFYSANFCSAYSPVWFGAFQDLEEFCFRFALNHLTAVVQTDAFHKLEESVVKTFITKAALYGAFKY